MLVFVFFFWGGGDVFRFVLGELFHFAFLSTRMVHFGIIVCSFRFLRHILALSFRDQSCGSDVVCSKK